ncbi:MAG: phosphotransferase [Desulfobacterales bacterium]
MELIRATLPQVEHYLENTDFSSIPRLAGRSFQVLPLAQGEYNLNYLIRHNGERFVFRVNIGTQIDRPDQIVYEYQSLKLVSSSGHTPRPLWVDDSRREMARGILIMEYLPGEPLDYRRDLTAAARLFAAIHQVPVPASHHLIAETAPLSLIYEECQGLLERYFNSELADPQISAYLQEVRQWADSFRQRESFYQADPWPCIVNTEVNSGNFIANREAETLHLVDWEMPRYGDPSQDLAHFCSPLTTLWKTDYRMDEAAKADFIRDYQEQIDDPHLRDTLVERLRLREPLVLLRGISWTAMGWVSYQTGFSGIKNRDTWATLERYLRLGFIRELFDPHLSAG